MQKEYRQIFIPESSEWLLILTRHSTSLFIAVIVCTKVQLSFSQTPDYKHRKRKRQLNKRTDGGSWA